MKIRTRALLVATLILSLAPGVALADVNPDDALLEEQIALANAAPIQLDKGTSPQGASGPQPMATREWGRAIHPMELVNTSKTSLIWRKK